MRLYRRLRIALAGCPVCGRPSWIRSRGRGRQRCLSFCRYAAAVGE